MHRFARVLCGIGVVTLTGLVWTSVNDSDPIQPAQTGAAIAQPPPTTAPEPETNLFASRGRAIRNAGGLPARGTGARRQRRDPLLSAAARSEATGSVTTPAPPTPSSPARAPVVHRELTEPSAALDTTGQPARIADSAPPAEEDRSKPRGIAGSVLEKGGAPAAGLPVNLRARRVFNGASSSAQTATTDGRGNFAFGAVADGEYEIYTEKNDRYERASMLVRSGSDSAVLIVEPAAENSLSIRGVVESTSGGALAGVRVEAIGHSPSSVTTDAKGAYSLRVPAGSRVEQTALRFRRTGYRERRWTLADGQRSSEYEVIGNVRLDPEEEGVPVAGVVTSTSGTPVARAQVQLQSAARGRSYRAVSDGDGRFTLANVEPGPGYRLWVRPQSGFKDGLVENVVVESATELAVQLTPIGAATLKGRMVTPEGAAVPGFSMFLVTDNAGGRRAASITSDADGRFLVADLPEGRVALQTRAAPALSVSGIELSATTAATEVTVVVDIGPHRFDGRLMTAGGEPAAGVSVSLEWSASAGSVTSRSTRQTTTDADGNFAFTQLGGGVHVVSAALAGAGSVRREHSIGAGLHPVELILPGKRGRQ